MRLVHIPLWIQQMHNGSLVSIKKFIAACWSTQAPAYRPLQSCRWGKNLAVKPEEIQGRRDRVMPLPSKDQKGWK